MLVHRFIKKICGDSPGLVPRQSSRGNKRKLLGISKHGDKYLRYLLVHGAKAVLYKTSNKTDSSSRWIVRLKERA